MNNRTTIINASVDSLITNQTDPGSIDPVTLGTIIGTGNSFSNPTGAGFIKMLLSQTGTAAPTIVSALAGNTAVMYENNTGAGVTLARTAAGTYTITLSASVGVIGKISVKIHPGATAGLYTVATAIVSSTTVITITTCATTDLATPADAILNVNPVEITVYP